MPNSAKLPIVSHVGVTWTAGTRLKPVNTVIPCAARATPARQVATSKVPAAAGKPGGGPLRYFLALCAIGGGIAGVWICLNESIEHVDIDYDGELPEFVDWSLEPGFPRVIHPCYNWTCGSCWAIAAVKSIEAVYAIKRRFALNLSVQQVIDCVAIEGCRGSTLVNAYDYISEAGLTLEALYPGPPSEGRSIWYGLLRGYCKMDGKPVAVKIKGHQRICPNKSLMIALQSSPVTVYCNINAFFGQYPGGVIEFEDCPSTSVKAGGKHCLLVVGYGVETDGKKYWKLMNTWGAQWSEAGYVRFRRGCHLDGVAGMTEHGGFRPVLSL